MNKNFTTRLNEIIRVETERRERIEAKKRKIEVEKKAREDARLRKLKFVPFNFSTESRSRRKLQSMDLRSKADLFSGAPMSNL